MSNSLSESYKSFVDTMLYEMTHITLEDIKASLNSKELQKKMTSYRWSDGEGLIAGGKSIEKGSHCISKSRHAPSITKNLISLGSLYALGYKYMGQGGTLKVSKGALVVMKRVLRYELYVLQGKASTMTTFERSTPKEKYLGDLDLDKVDECRSLRSINKSSKFIFNRVITFDKPILVEQYKNSSRRTGGETCEEG
ncbi:hypothetical protein CRG98_014898 [Punica granatum]|uniref:Uncharacterized protein n=1 Tax=Punica granatum TaxID=22663 RepID=A0A2I0K826_PUNGR|nr:hypothetical protein CRG98_014898 [Punica granatum]